MFYKHQQHGKLFITDFSQLFATIMLAISILAPVLLTIYVGLRFDWWVQEDKAFEQSVGTYIERMKK